MSFWHGFNEFTKKNGPTIPLRNIRHGSQVYYSKIKTGVDGTSKQAVVLRSPTIKLGFDMKYSSNNLAKNFHAAHVSRKLVELNSNLGDNFTAKHFKNKFSHKESLGDFTHQACKELIEEADFLLFVTDKTKPHVPKRVSDQRSAELIRKAKSVKRYKLAFLIVLME